MIISASRRTDIPTFYSDWFFNRIKEGVVLVRNPRNYRQISRVYLTPDVVDGIVLWTKNPVPMIGRLDELRNFMYYFQFTITPYGKDIEPGLPQKSTDILTDFKRISEIIGVDRIIWRYDPILLNDKYTFDYHIHAFGKIAKELHGYTGRVTISFVDTNYRGLKSNIEKLKLVSFDNETQIKLASKLASVAHSYGLSIDTCAEGIDLTKYGIRRARCIDAGLLSKLLGCELNVEKDKSQRPECGCISSIDIGMYNTCLNCCLYCYANYNKNTVEGNCAKHNPCSPMLSGYIGPDDKITERTMKLYSRNQLGLDCF